MDRMLIVARSKVLAPCRLPQERIGLLKGGKRHGVTPLNVMRHGRHRKEKEQ